MFQCSGVPVFRGVPECSGVPGCSGVPVFRCSGVPVFLVLVHARQKCGPLQIIEPSTEKTWELDCVIFGEQKNKERNGETPLRTGKYFE